MSGELAGTVVNSPAPVPGVLLYAVKSRNRQARPCQFLDCLLSIQMLANVPWRAQIPLISLTVTAFHGLLSIGNHGV